MIKKLTSKLAFLLAVVAATAVGGITTAVVMAAIPDTNGQITACRRNGTGAARIIDTASQSCNILESPVSWSQGNAADNTEVISKVVTIPNGAPTQDLFTIPEFGTIRSLECSESQAIYDVYNSTSHDVITGIASRNRGINPPGQSFTNPIFLNDVDGSARAVPNVLLSYAAGGESRTANVTFSYSAVIEDGFSTGCRYQIQAIISTDEA